MGLKSTTSSLAEAFLGFDFEMLLQSEILLDVWSDLVEGIPLS